MSADTSAIEQIALQLIDVVRDELQLLREELHSLREERALMRQVVAAALGPTSDGPAGRPVASTRRRPEDPEKVRARHERYRQRHPQEWRQRRQQPDSLEESAAIEESRTDVDDASTGAPVAPPDAGPLSKTEYQVRNSVRVNSRRELTGPPYSPPTAASGDPVDQVATLVRKAGVPVVVADADRRAIRGCSAEPQLIADAFVAAAQGKWMGGDRWLRENLSLRTVVERLSGYLATRGFSDRVGPPLELVTD